MQQTARTRLGPVDVTGPAPELVWPSGIVSPQRPPVVVYLDLNHWIGLAKANTEHPRGADYLPLLRACRQAKQQGTARFVLSMTHYMELGTIRLPRRRNNIAEVMEELTEHEVLLSRQLVMKYELEAAIDTLAGPSTAPLEPTDLILHGLLRAQGLSGDVRIVDKETRADASDLLRRRIGDQRFVEAMAFAQSTLDQAMLYGPDDGELIGLQSRGYDPSKVRAVAEQRAEPEQELVALNDADTEVDWRRGRLRDLVACRELANEMIDSFTRLLMNRDLSVADLVTSDRDRIRAFTRCMPGAEVAIEIKTQYHRDRGHRWTHNDMYDIDALSLAVPYCDVVFTDAAVRNALYSAKLGERMGTLLPRTVTDMVAILDSL